MNSANNYEVERGPWASDKTGVLTNMPISVLWAPEPWIQLMLTWTPDPWKLWTYNLWTFLSTKFMVICYAAIESKYTYSTART